MSSLARVIAHLAIATCVAAPVRAIPAQDPVERSASAVWGYVVDQFGQPVVGAEVTLAPPEHGSAVRAGAVGTYRLDSLAPGAHRLRVRALGYLPLTVSVDAKPGDMTARDIALVKLPFALDPTLVQSADGELRASFADFTTRRAVGQGTFIDRAAIDELRPRTATDLMRVVKSFRVQSAGRGSYRLAGASNASGASCAVRYLVDGFPYAPTDGLNDFDPEHIGAVEAYGAGEVPPALDPGGAGCGTIVVWLRR